MRFYARPVVVRQFGADDLLDDVYGRHNWDVPITAQTDEYPKNLLLTGILYNCSAMSVKLSLLLLYNRLFRPAKSIQIPTWLGIVVITMFYMICNILTLVFCLPRPGEGGWGAAKYTERCGTQYLKLTTVQGVFSVASDFYVLFIPVGTIMRLQLSLKKRIGVTSVFLSGLLACGVSMAGAVYRFRDELAPQSDYTWDGIYIQSFGCVAQSTQATFRHS
ncbi:hypothetical protein E8E14_003818 [Neopestalotiopsis sp. 37M]|nr:hypothetical protein E8E14_003818 [Neopestalotiopsis sp. 37M]